MSSTESKALFRHLWTVVLCINYVYINKIFCQEISTSYRYTFMPKTQFWGVYLIFHFYLRRPRLHISPRCKSNVNLANLQYFYTGRNTTLMYQYNDCNLNCKLKGCNSVAFESSHCTIARPYLAIGQGGQLPPQRNWLQSILFVHSS